VRVCVCVCVRACVRVRELITTVSPTKTAEPIETTFGLWTQRTIC